MDADALRLRFAKLSTAHVADGCLRAGLPVRCAPAAIQAREPGARLAGRALPVRHVGSVDVFLEAFEAALHGDVLVVDNGGRLDESCVGDLVALEAQMAGVAGILIWGLNRDSADLRAIDVAVFSLGTLPTGPLAVGDRPADALESATIGPWTVTGGDAVFGDDDGVLFVEVERVDEVLDHAEAIRDTERRQAERIRSGDTLRAQVHFERFLAARDKNPLLGFREHLRSVGGEIEV
jgi:regulator of RNase E activity RraA